MKLKMMYSSLNTDLSIIEKELEATIEAEHPLLKQAGLHLLKAGGKRIRPVFVLLSGKFGQYDIHKMKYAAVALELIHMSSLVHDDVIDDAELRRGKPTIKAKWDNRIAMYTGDFLFARSLELMAKLNNLDAHKILSEALVDLCRGEIDQIKDKFNFSQNTRNYLRRIKRKTALLIAVSCQLGAIAADAPEEIHKKLYLFGYYVGMSYQIIDDILDFTSTEKQLGKPVGGDLLQGNVTLPVFLAMEDPAFRGKIEALPHEPKREDLEPVISMVKNSDAIQKSFHVSDMYMEKAYDILEQLPDIKARETLRNIAKSIARRKF